ncbi:MAG: tail fiber domain-containing protein, partial [bacterium]
NGAVNASDATFMGYQAGMNATNASGSLFAGNMAGNGADSANSSIILGYQAGYNAAGVSDFLGTTHNVHNVSGGVSFLGYQAGYDALGAAQSTFIGTQAGYKAYGASGSFIAGLQAGYNDEDIPDFLGESQAPIPGTSGGVTFIGVQSGYGAATAIQSTFIGTQAGYQAKNSPLSTFIGFMAGSMTNGYPTQSVKTSPQGGLFGTTAIGLLAAQNAYNAYDSVFLGNLVANAATDAHDSVFIGSSAGREAVNAAWSVFLGKDAGDGSDNAKVSTFLGPKAGSGAQNAKNSIFIGQSAGNSDPVFNSLATITYSNLANGPYKLGDWINGSISGAGGYIVSDNGSVLEIAGVSYAAFVPGDVISTNQPDDLATATVDSFTYGSSSILIGADSSTGGYSNSIALGAYAMNSATNQFIIGSQLSPINEVRIEQAGGTNCTITSIGLNCTSDENLKTNISDLSSNILDPLSRLRTVTYNWKTQPNGKRMIGFLAQDLEQYFPELVTTDKQGQKSVNYANMTPVLVEAVKELNVKLANIQTVSTTINPSLFESITNWLADKTNGINKLFVHEVCLTDGTDEECITMQQLRQLKAGQSIQQGVPVPEDTGNITTTPDTSTTSSDQGLGDATTTTSDSGVDPVSEPEGVTTDPSPIVPEPSPITETDTTTTP